MKRAFFLSAGMGIVASMAAFAQSTTTTQVITPQQTVTTTLQSPTDTPPAAVTKITTSPAPSVITKAKDGSKIEIDSDNSVYTVFPDGARTAAPDGITTLIDGTTITVKEGKRIP